MNNEEMRKMWEAAADIKSEKIVTKGTSTTDEGKPIHWSHSYNKDTGKSNIIDKFGKRDATVKPFESKVKPLGINRPRDIPQSPIE